MRAKAGPRRAGGRAGAPEDAGRGRPWSPRGAASSAVSASPARSTTRKPSRGSLQRARCARGDGGRAGRPASSGARPRRQGGVVVRLGVLGRRRRRRPARPRGRGRRRRCALSTPAGGTSRADASSTSRTCCADRPGRAGDDAGGGAGRPRRRPSRCRCAARAAGVPPGSRGESTRPRPGAAIGDLVAALRQRQPRPSRAERGDGHHLAVGARVVRAAPAGRPCCRPARPPGRPAGRRRRWRPARAARSPGRRTRC